MKGISLLGATGSIGTQTIDIIRSNRDQFELVAIAVGKNLELTRKLSMNSTPNLFPFKIKRMQRYYNGNLRVSVKFYLVMKA